MTSKNSFVLYTDYLEPLEDLSMEQRGLILTAIMNYSVGRELPEMDAASRVAFSFIKQQLDRDTEKWEDVKTKRAEAGAKGGKQKVANSSKSKQMLANDSKTEQNVTNQAVNVNVNVNDNVNVIKKEKDKKEKSTRLANAMPPSLEEVTEYCKERGNNVDPETFINFYASKGWKVGSQPMKDWRACVRTWEKREKPKAPPGNKIGFNDFPQRTYDYDELEKQFLAN